VPAINLSRLRLQAFELSGLLADPAAFQTYLRSLLDEHSHRLLRRGRSMAERGALTAWDVPGILIREVEAALLPAAQNNGRAALAAAEAIWPAGKLEERQLAAYLAGLSGLPAEVRTLLQEWLAEAEDPILLQDLAAHTCPPLWAANFTLFRSDVRSWIEHSLPVRRRFGWMALRAWVEEKTSEATFAAFDLLPAIFKDPDPETMRLASGLLAALAEFAPQETQGWLAELSPDARVRGRKFLRGTAARMPEEMGDFLRGVLQKG
jgi:hypothetical protein